MATRFGTGLVVGKFAPLHRGHELVIRRALATCERVVIVSYSEPKFSRCEPEQREQWLAQAFPEALRLVVTPERLRQSPLASRGFTSVPHNDADETLHRRFVFEVCANWLDVQVDAVFTSEDYGDGFARVLTECYRLTAPGYPEVRHVCVDLARASVPISGTALRANVHDGRAFLSGHVYASFVERVVLLGGESSGKSTLTRALAQRFATAWVDEYGRELWERQAGQLSQSDLDHIAEEQARREQAALPSAHRYLFCDTSPLTTLLYSFAMFGSASEQLQRLAERRYAHTFVCAPDIPFEQDGTRRDPAFRDAQHQWTLAQLQRRGVAYAVLSGNVEERVLAVVEALGRGPRPSLRD